MPKLPTPTKIHLVIEKFPGGVNAIPFKSLDAAINRFKVILEENLNPNDMDEDNPNQKVIDDAVKKKYWSTCEGDYEQEITLELATVTLND